MMKDMLLTERYLENKIHNLLFKPGVENVLVEVGELFNWGLMMSTTASQYMMTCIICQSNENE